MAAKGDFLHGKLDETESLLRLENYYRDLAYGNSVTLQYYREQNADLFDAWEQTYHDKTYTLYTDSLSLDYALLSQLVSEYDTVAGYGDFLDSVQTKAGQLAGISIFQNDETGYDLKNIEVTAAVCAGLGETAIDYYPQKGLYTAISYAFTDLILLVSMLVQALLLVRQERDSDALHDADHGRAVPVPLFAGQVGRRVCHGAVGHAGGTRCPPGGCRMGGRPGRAACDVWHPRRDSGHQPAECD